MPFNQRPIFTPFPADTRLWLHQEPRCLTSRQLSSLLNVEPAVTKDPSGYTDNKSVDMTMLIDEASAIDSTSGGLVERYEMVEVCDAGSCATSEKTKVLGLDLDGPWIGHGKSEHWWRTADGSELASFVTMKSSDHLENCDLPPPRKVQFRKHQSSPHVSSLEYREAARSSVPTQTSCDSEESVEERWAATKSFRSHGEGGGGIANLNPEKAQLQKALCHSQTRAREAEMTTKRALEEKGHVVKLLYRQASQLFAYKQWFQWLQLEATAPRRGSTVVPILFPWVVQRGKKAQKRWNKGSRCGQGRSKPGKKHDDGKYAVVFAVGLGLVGAGFLLGWTVGWTLPLF